jgi:hypothetical protein
MTRPDMSARFGTKTRSITALRNTLRPTQSGAHAKASVEPGWDALKLLN